MGKKRGFSLVELLGVIVVLAVILAIAVPKVLASIDTASKKAFTSDVDSFVGIAKLEYNEKSEGNKKDIYYTFEEGEQVSKENEIRFKGENPYEGYILITEDGKVELELVSSNRKWCASKELDDAKAIIDKCSVKEKTAINLKISTTNTTKSITVTVSPQGLDTYYYSIDDGSFAQSKENIKIYNKLDKNKTYKIKVRGCKKNSKCETVEKKVTLPNIDAPKYAIKNNPENQTESKGWAKSRTVTINYNQTKDKTTDYSTLINQYIYANTEADLYQKLINNNWTNCIDNSNLKKDTCVLPAFTSDAYVIARVTDEHNTVTNSSILTLTNFDTENPTAPVIQGGSDIWTSTSRTISVKTASTAKSGIKKYQYYVSTSSTGLSGGSWKDCSTSKTRQKFTENGEYYIFFRAVSYAGNVSNASNYQVVKVDNVSPTVTLKATKTTSASAVSTNTWSNETLNFTLTKGTTGKSSYTIYYCKDTDNKCIPDKEATSGTLITTWNKITGTYYVRYYIKSGAGLKTDYASYTAKVDTTSPTVPTSVIRYDSSKGTVRENANSWTNKTLWWGNFSSTDTQSGVDHYEYSDGCNGSKTGNLTTSYTYSNNKNKSYCIRAVDKVGNESEWSSAYYFKIDKTAPTVPTSVIRYDSSTGTVRENANSWTNKTLWWGKFSSTDTQSGVDHYEYSDGCNGSKTGNLTTSYTYSNDQNKSYCIKAVDKVGNESEWSSAYYFKIDKTIPTVAYSIPGAAYTSKQDLNITGVDTNFSYMNVHVYKYDGSSWKKDESKSKSSYTSKTYSVSLTTGRWKVYTKVFDKAGNKQSQSPSDDNGWYYQEYIIAQPTVTYKVAKMGTGKWSEASNGGIAGTTGQSQALDQFQITSFSNGLSNSNVLTGKIKFQLHKQNCGDLAENDNWCIVNNERRNTGLRIEAIKIYLEGDIKEYYSVIYQVHVQSQGWLGWTADGNWTGSKNLCKRIEAIKIQIVPKASLKNYLNDTTSVYLSKSTKTNCAANDDKGSSSTGDQTKCESRCITKSTCTQMVTDFGTMSKGSCYSLGGTCRVGDTTDNCACTYCPVQKTERICSQCN